MANQNNTMSNDGIIRKGDYLPMGKKTVLGIQHVFTMFGSTVLVPLLTGLDVSVALFGAGVGTLIFHLTTQGKVPAFLGSSFAFIPVIITVGMMGGAAEDLRVYCKSTICPRGIGDSGYSICCLSLIIKLIGLEAILSLFPPIVTGPIIMVIGLNLAPTAVDMASGHWPLAIICLLAVTVINIYFKGFFKVLPVLGTSCRLSCINSPTDGRL